MRTSRIDWKTEKIQNGPVDLPYPGRRARKIAKTALVSALILLTVLGSIGTVLPGIVKALEGHSSPLTTSENAQCPPTLPNATTTVTSQGTSCSNPASGSNSPLHVGADMVHSPSVPKTVLSSVDSLIGAGGVIQSSSQNITLYNLAISLRLLGGATPHDELLSRDHHVLSLASWQVYAIVGTSPVPLIPMSNNFTFLGTTRTGTSVLRTMQVAMGSHLGNLSIVYEATSKGPLKWNLGFSPAVSGHYVFVYTWDNATSNAQFSAVSSYYRVSYGGYNYTLSWSDVPSSINSTVSVRPPQFQLWIDMGSVAAKSKIQLDPSLIGTSTSASPTGNSFQRKVFFEPTGGYYFVFYYDGNSVGYRYSHDGVAWSSKQSMPSLPLSWPVYYNDPASLPSVLNSGQNVVVASGEEATDSGCTGCLIVGASIYYVIGAISGSTITWQQVQRLLTFTPASNAGYGLLTFGFRYVSIALDSANTPVFSYNFYANDKTGGYCTPGASQESVLGVVYKWQNFLVSCSTNYQNQERSAIVPAAGGARLVYQKHPGAGVQLLSRLFWGTGPSSVTVATNGDAFVDNCCSDSNTNHGSDQILWLRAPTEPYESDLLIKFPTLPMGSFVTRATLKLTASGGGSGVDDVNVYEAAASWSEMTVTFNNKPGTVGTSLVTNPSVNLASYGVGNVLSLDATYALEGVSLGFWTDNGLFITMPANPNNCANWCYIPVYSREYNNGANTPTLAVSYNCCIGSPETLDANMMDGNSFSATVDANLGVHVVWNEASDGTVSYAYRSATGTSWGPPWRNIFSGPASSPILTSDVSTNDVYSLALSGTPASSIVMRKRAITGNWTDQSLVFPVTKRNSPAYLGANFASASTTTANAIELIWTEGPSPYNVTFASIPIQTVWSPYAAPSDPWDGNGISPYGQYFSNLGEYVSPSTGLLTIRQTDLNVPGRGLNLDITRVYTEPYSFINGVPYNYENYPWAPMGDGWQFNFPWMSNAAEPSYLHLSDGQGYRIPFNFWIGATATFDNHQGDNFRLVRYVSGTIVLFDRSGALYTFGTGPSHALVSISDSTGNDTITFNYSNNLISCISDTVQRAFRFSYSGGFVQQISQVNGSCTSPGSAIRSITYGNNGQSLTNVTDPANRITAYSYGSNPWLLAQITYPTGWYDGYTYTSYVLGTVATAYRVSLQQVMAGSTSTVRHFAYNYTQGVGDQILGSTVTSYNGTRIASYTKYAFSFLLDVKNITDASGNLLSGDEQFFGVNGQIPKEIVLVSDGHGNIGSYTNYYSYDLWGNQIYSRRAINPSSNLYHESFNAFYNNGEPPGLYAFQESFSRNQGTAPDNSWSAYNGSWIVNNYVYSGSYTSGAEEPVFAWSNISRADLSMQAQVYLGQQIDTSTGTWHRFGIFVHHNTGIYKWALVIHTTGGSPVLELLDEWNEWLGQPPPNGAGQASAMNSCSSWTSPLIKFGSWYTFNMTVRGNSATGWVSSPGQPSCSVSGTFPSSSPALGGTGFGLYAGGYSVMFDDVQVATVSPFITGSGFSNSFIQSGAPGPVGLNTWLTTTKPPAPGWNTTSNWLPATGWSQAYASVNYGGPSWGTITGWPDTNAQWIWWDTNANQTASPDNVWFRRVFYLPTTTNIGITITVDNGYTLYVDGVKLGYALGLGHWGTPDSYTDNLLPGYHIMAINATNTDGPDPAGLLVSVKNTATSQVLFRSDATAGPATSVLASTAQLQNGSTSLSLESYYAYTFSGELTKTTRKYGGDVSPANVTIVAWPVYVTALRSWGLTVDQPLPDPWWPQDEITVQSANHTQVTILALSTGLHYVEFGVSGFMGYPYAWHAKIFVNGNLRAEQDVGRDNHLRAYIVAGTQWLNTTMTYDRYGNLGNFTDARGNVTRYVYSPVYSYAYPTSVTETLKPSSTQITTIYSYNFNTGTVSSMVDNNGNNSTYQYDILERSIRIAYPTGDYMNYTYNDRGNFVDITNENFLKTRQIYDGLGRPSTTERFTGSRTGGTPYSNETYLYNWQNNVVSQKNALGNTYTFTYDALGRLNQTGKPDGNSTSLSFNDLQSWVVTTNENGTRRCNTYDRLGRLLTVIEYSDKNCNALLLSGNPYVTSYNYDEIGNLLRVTNAATQSTLYSYDNLGRLVGIGYPDGTFESYGYDNDGNLVNKVDRANIRTLSSYDSLNRISATTYCGATIIGTSYSYDKNSNPLQILNQNATVSYIYDSRNRVLNETYAVNPATRTIVDVGCSGTGSNITRTGGVAKTYTVGWTYQGELLNTLMYPTVSVYNPDITIKYAYDGLGRVLNVTNQATSAYYARSFTYYKNDQVKGFQFGNNLIQNYTYDSLSRSSTIRLSGTTTMSLAYSYNKTGTVASVTGFVNGATMNETYRYDPLQRLTNSTVKSSGSTTTSWYEYDNLGNRARQKLNSTITRYSYNSVNELTNSTTYSSPQITASYSYDPNGNLKTLSVTGSGTVVWTYSWDASNRLLKVTNSTGQVQYAYDGSGRMVEAAETSVPWFIAYAGTDMLYKHLQSTDNYEYVYAAGIRIVMVIDRTSTYYYHADALGSIRMITYSDSTYVYINNYLPYGQDNGTPKGVFQNRAVDKFVGERWTAATGLFYDFQRWYDPSVGRFISPDPMAGDISNPQSVNAYTYASDSPATITDPSGLTGMYTSVRGSDPCRASKDFWGHLGCSFTNPQAIILGLEYSPEGAAAGWLIWGAEEGGPYLPLIVTGVLTLGAVGFTAGYELLAGQTGQLKLPDISWSNVNRGGVLRTGITGPGSITPDIPRISLPDIGPILGGGKPPPYRPDYPPPKDLGREPFQPGGYPSEAKGMRKLVRAVCGVLLLGGAILFVGGLARNAVEGELGMESLTSQEALTGEAAVTLGVLCLGLLW